MSDKRYPTRMHEVLGVGVDEEATYKSTTKELKEFRFFVDEYGSPRYPSRLLLDGYDMANIINHPERITRRPRLTEEQVDELKALLAFSMKWLVIDKDWPTATAYGEKPFKEDAAWYGKDRTAFKTMELPEQAKVTALVSWSDPEPLDIVQTLREAGVVVSEMEKTTDEEVG